MSHTLILLIILTSSLAAWSQEPPTLTKDQLFLKPSQGYPEKDKTYTRKDIYTPPSQTRQIRLKLTIEEGLRKNPDQNVRNLKDNLLDSQWRDVSEDFWFPDIDLVMEADSKRVGRIRQGTAFNQDPTRIPVGSLGLSFGDYTIFNWGKDYAKYLNARANYFRNKRNLVEARRYLRHSLVIRYFQLSMIKAFERIYLNQLQHASFIYRLSREKAPQRKVTKQEYLMARAEYLRAREEYQQSIINSAVEDEQFAYFLGDNLDTSYRLVDALVYEKLNIPLKEILFLTNKNSPTIQNKRQELANAARTYELTLKENLPLPKLTLNLGAYKQNFTQGLGSFGSYETTSPGNKNIDLTASINVTWSLLGDGGFFNHRKNTQAHLGKRIAERELLNNRQLTYSRQRQLFKRVLNLETQVDIFKANLSNAQKNFDSTFENYVKGKTTFLDFKNALLVLRDAEINLERATFQHLKHKVMLANTMGLADFPGRRFELLGKEQ